MSEAHPYLTLKLALALFKKPPDELEAPERQRVEQVAARQLEIERRILATPEAARTVLPMSSIEQAVAEIRGRYASDDEFVADLKKAHLDPPRLAAALARELKFNAVLDGVAGRVAEASEADVEIFYLMHRERFHRPEMRTLRHILVTINDDLPGSERAAARDKIDAIRAQLARSPEGFAEQALKHSECPTATNGGLLGTLRRDQLYTELAGVAFALATGELSAAVESPLGFHLLDCVAIQRAGEESLASVRDKIREQITASRREAQQKAWIAGLFTQARPARPKQPSRKADRRERRAARRTASIAQTLS
jgi:peptidyl-prolyl cis-trans isomerase C